MTASWLNGTLHESIPTLSPYDLAVTQGAAAFEMTRSFQQHHFRLDEHLARLKSSCNLLGIPLKYSVASLREACYEVTRQTAFPKGDEHRLMIVASPGAPKIYQELASTEPWVMITDFPLRYTTAGMGRQFTGATAAVSRINQIPESSIPARSKHRSRLHFHRAQTQAGSAWAIMTDHEGLVCECPGANLVMVYRGHVVPIQHNCLPGISQAFAIELARKDGFTVSHGNVELRDFLKADEIWVTGTPFCMIPIINVKGTGYHKPEPGPVYRRVLELWSQEVGVDIASQIQEWDDATTE